MELGKGLGSKICIILLQCMGQRGHGKSLHTFLWQREPDKSKGIDTKKHKGKCCSQTAAGTQLVCY